MNRLILATNSERRQQLMRDAGYVFDIQTLDIDESFDEGMAGHKVAEHLSIIKNHAYRSRFESEIILTADTVVLANNEILGKPENEDDAFKMIQKLTKASHEVVSGVTISTDQKSISFSDRVEVEFESLTEKEIRFYIEQYKPFDKAGAYGIQEWIGMIGIKRINGSFYTVMGLPIHEVYKCMKNDFDLLPNQNLKSRPTS
ncbi:MAG: septum formation protein Maf [Reichenbachiella sp.]